MFQLERLTVVKETLIQIIGEMGDDRIETTDGMIEAATVIARDAEWIKERVIRERLAREAEWIKERAIGELNAREGSTT